MDIVVNVIAYISMAIVDLLVILLIVSNYFSSKTIGLKIFMIFMLIVGICLLTIGMLFIWDLICSFWPWVLSLLNIDWLENIQGILNLILFWGLILFGFLPKLIGESNR